MTHTAGTLLLDAHVHLYDCFDAGRFLNAARRNFSNQGAALSNHPDNLAQCLLCVDLQDRLLDTELQKLQSASDFELLPATREEPCSRTLRHRESGWSVQIVWGYQIITAENLEVLAFGIPEPVSNGLPLDAVLHQLQPDRAPQAFGILPWGFGKWLGHRGELIDKAITAHAGNETSPWFVGDNGGRWRQLPLPALIEKAVSDLDIWNIPGSDPLPFPQQADKVGSRGVVLTGDYDELRPCASVRQMLLSLAGQPVQYGRGETLTRFIQAQVRMQLRKHRRK